MGEIWMTLEEFPQYAVSDQGVIANIATQRDVQYSYTKHGVVKVGLMRDGVQCTRSVRVLVAETFIQGRSDIFNTPINLDGDQSNNVADNLAWRPRWFAWQYTRQFTKLKKEYSLGPVKDVTHGDVYADVYEAGVVNGLLFDHVLRSIKFVEEVFPTKQAFVLAKK